MKKRLQVCRKGDSKQFSIEINPENFFCNVKELDKEGEPTTDFGTYEIVLCDNDDWRLAHQIVKAIDPEFFQAYKILKDIFERGLLDDPPKY